MAHHLCNYAQLALSVAGCTQVLSEAGHEILQISINKNAAFVSIAYTPKTKKLCGRACGSTYHKGSLHFVYQKDICGVLVRWLEPCFDAQTIAKQVH